MHDTEDEDDDYSSRCVECNEVIPNEILENADQYYGGEVACPSCGAWQD